MSGTVFVSYSHDDGGFVKELLEKLDDAKFEVWTDQKIPEGNDWISSIDDAIKRSFAVLVIITPGSMASPYVTYEWSMAIGLELRILPILLKKTSKIHPKLNTTQWIDFQNYNHKWTALINRLNELRQEYINSPKAVSATLALLNEARSQYQSNNLLDALEFLQRAERYATDDLLDNIYYEMALVHLRRKEESEAEEYLQKVLSYNPKHIHSLIILGSLYRRQADKVATKNKQEELLASVEAHFRRVLELQPEILDADGESVWGSLGGVLKRRGKTDEAIDAYKKAAQVKKSSYPYNNLGLLYLEKRDTKQMRQNFKLVELFTEQKRKNDPGDEWVHNDYFIAKVILEDITEAENALSTLLIIAHDDALQSLHRTLESLKTVEEFKSEVRDFIDKTIVLIEDRIKELNTPIEV